MKTCWTKKKTRRSGRNMTKSYTTISGDMWDKIAFEQMGSVLHTDKLMKANVKYASTYVFPAGGCINNPGSGRRRRLGTATVEKGAADVE